MTFELSFTYPISNVKCTVDKVRKGQTTDIICKMQKVKNEFEFNSLILEPKLLKKKKKEILFIQGITYNLSESFKCENYNVLKNKLAKARKDSPFSFLQIGHPQSYTKLFFLALMKKKEDIPFVNQNYNVSLIISKPKLRVLEETLELDDIQVNCEVKESSGNSASFDCDDGSGYVPLKVDIDSANIAGVPDDATVEKNPNPDYSKKETLKLIDSLPNIYIYNVISNNCSLNGTYIIEANYNDDKASKLDGKDNITIPFSTPDSKGLCVIKVNSEKTILMTCENTEAFTPIEMIIPSQIINDEDDTTPLFRIAEDYTVPTIFTCTISDKSLKVPFPTKKTNSFYKKIGSSGLSGGAIAGIVISLVAVIAIVVTLIILLKKGVFSGMTNITPALPYEENSAVKQFDESNPNSNMV